jgi:transcriptional regulator with XRE-family HTH domain
MKRPADTFEFPAELGQRLRDLRLKAGLTQPELAQAMGRTGKGKACIVSRMEKGSVRFPSLGLVADFLRGCRAGFREITDILDLYTALPTTQQKVYHVALGRAVSGLEPRVRKQVVNYDLRFDVPKARVRSQPVSIVPDRLRRLERARKNAAAARRHYFYGEYLKFAVNNTGLKPVMTVTEPLFKHGLEWFGILYRTSQARPGMRERLLSASHDEFAEASGFPLDAIRKLEDGVRRRFAELEMAGELNWLPNLSLEEYEASLLAPGRKRTFRQEQHQEYVRRFNAYDAARNAATQNVWAEVQPMLDEKGVPGERRPVYRGLVGSCCTAALSFEPGSAGEKRQLDEYILNPQWIGLGLDTTLAQKLAAFVLPRFRELAKSLPPDPRPKR